MYVNPLLQFQMVQSDRFAAIRVELLGSLFTHANLPTVNGKGETCTARPRARVCVCVCVRARARVRVLAFLCGRGL
jgi:hypothetical protein